METASLQFERDGLALHGGVLGAENVQALRAVCDDALATGAPGVRLMSDECANALTRSGSIHEIAAQYLGPLARAVRAIAFDKSQSRNWSIGWHQDRTIAVKERANVGGFGPWSRKRGVAHVEPPIEVLQRMVTLRIHMDDVDELSAPLVVALGTHRIGRVDASQVGGRARGHEHFTCLAKAGDVWAYRTPILHRSERSCGGGRRRVLQVDYAGEELPGGLAWLGVE